MPPSALTPSQDSYYDMSVIGPLCKRHRCRIAPFIDQGGPPRGPRADASALASALGGPAGARVGPQAQPVSDHPGSSGMRPVMLWHGTLFPRSRLSGSRPPCLGRSLRSRSHAISSADPDRARNLPGIGSYEKNGCYQATQARLHSRTIRRRA